MNYASNSVGRTAMTLYLLCFVYLFVTCFTHVQGELDSKLKYYEFVDDLQVHSIAERSAEEDVTIKTSRKLVKFSAMGRNFSIHLKPVSGLFSPDFKAEVVDKNNHKTPFNFDKDNFFEGKVDGDDKSQVTMYFDQDDTITARISTQEDDMVVEPEWRHSQRLRSGKTKKTMVIYHTKDVKWSNQGTNDSSSTSFCGAQHASEQNFERPESKSSHHHHSEDEHDEHHRAKRSTGAIRCRVMAVADYKFYSGTGGGNIYQTVNYIVGVMQKTNLIYLHTNFGGHTGVGFELAAMRVHTEYTATPGNAIHYNMAGSWYNNKLGLLNTFSADANTWDDYCLAHLFTHQAFADNTLGLAYIASENSNEIGGICSPVTYLNSVRVSVNTAWSSTMDTSGRTVLARQAELVTAHELGHNWGSEHDNPSSDTCAPSSFFGDGKYLMYPYSVTGADPNNDKFSTCSQTSIGRVLSSKRSSCFSAATPTPTCGNGRIDPEEECDGGYLTRFGLDSCCTSECILSPGSVCSPANSPCCSASCQVAPANTICNSNINCKLEARCDGVQLTCPEGVNKVYGTPCTGGFCNSGDCVPFCEFNNRISCACSTIENSCKRCCKNGANAACAPYNNVELLLDGQSCIKGYCSGGVCIETNPGVIERLFDFLEDISFDKIAEMFKTNMVAFTQLFSIILWIPLSCVVYCWDKRKSKAYRKEMAFECRKDRTLTYDEDKRNVRIKKITASTRLVPGPRSPLPPITPRSTSGGARRNRVEPVS